MTTAPEASIRPYKPDDIHDIHKVVVSAAEHDGVDPLSTLESVPTLDELAESLENNNTNPETDVFVAVDEETKDIVGYGKLGWWQEEDGTFVYIHQGHINPSHRGKGIGSELLQTLQDRIREVAAEHPADAPKTFGTNASETETAALGMLEKQGYKKVWSQLEMEFTDFDNLNDVEQPVGFVLRGADTPEEQRKVYEANVRVYEGRPGATPASEEDFQDFLASNPDLSLWKVAWDGENVAGFVLSRDLKDKGEITEVATVPEYRRRGLGKWLMAENLKDLHARGLDIVRLHTNSEGEQGGRQLYQSMGFSALKESHRLRKPLDDKALESYIGSDGKFKPEHIGQLFYDSFRFSQGGTGIQQQIFVFLKERYGDKLSPELIESGVVAATPRIVRFATGGANHVSMNDSTVLSSIDTEKKVWKSVMRDGVLGQARFDPHDMLTKVLIQEAKYVDQGGRSNRAHEDEQTSRSSNRHISHFIFYGLLGNDTGSPEYNALFSELVDNLHDIPDNIAREDTTHPNPFVPVLPIFERHFAAYPGDVARITPRGLAVLRERFEPNELQQLGIV